MHPPLDDIASSRRARVPDRVVRARRRVTILFASYPVGLHVVFFVLLPSHLFQ